MSALFTITPEFNALRCALIENGAALPAEAQTRVRVGDLSTALEAVERSSTAASLHLASTSNVETFLLWMAERYVEKADVMADWGLQTARPTLNEFILQEGFEFGGDTHSWDRSTAYELVDEEMSNWEG